jgi:signal transduction histidine kinase/CheY-like chemotaxis protein
MTNRFGIILFTLLCFAISGFASNMDNHLTTSDVGSMKDSIGVLLRESEFLLDSIPDLSAKKAQRARQLAVVLDMDEQEAYASLLLGRAKLNLKEYYTAEKHLRHALIRYNSWGIEDIKAKTLYNLALAEYQLTYLPESIEHFEQAASYFKEEQKELDLANTFQNLGLVYQSGKHYEKSKQYYKQAFEIYEKLSDYAKMAGIYQNLGILNDSLGKDSLALSNYNKTIEYYKEAHDLQGIGITYSSIGLYYLKNDVSKKAFKNFDKSLTYFTKVNFVLGQIWALNNMGSAKAMNGEFTEAENLFNRSLKIAKSINHQEGIITNYADLAKIYEQRGFYKKSLYFQKKYVTIKDSLNTFQAQTRINKLEKLYQDENREKEASQIDSTNKWNKIRIWIISGFLSVIILTSLVILSAHYQKRKAEKKLAEHKTNLERLVETRTKELQIQISERKIAEESDKLKSAFLANMSHELRTPMNAIIAFSNFLREPDVNNEKRDEYLDHITTAGDSLLRIIDDIIDIAKIESKQLKLFIQPTNINRLLNELYNVFCELRKKDNKKQIKLSQKMDCEFNYIINTDSQRLKQILTNLIENAFKYTDKGKIEIGFETTNQAVVFYVSDTGIGIPKDKLNLIFDRFYQLNHLKDRSAGGTGLGLAISKNLVKLLGGKIWVESVQGKGSKFSISIPVESIKKQINPVFKLEEKKNEILKPGYNWNNITILVAEDEDLNYKVLDTCLTRTNAHIIRAKDGASAVEICKSQKIDLVLMDIQMPGMNGYEATQEIKRMNNRTPVIAQTSFAMVGEKERCLQAGCDDFVTKPLNISSLLNKIENYIK